MGELFLKSKDKFFIEEKFYIVKRGKVLLREVLPNGKSVTSECYLGPDDILGNFFNILGKNELLLDVEVEIEALEDAVLEEFKIPIFNKFNKNGIMERILLQLAKKSMTRLYYHMYNKNGYILSIFKLYANEHGEVNKDEVNYDIFNISKSQFYLILSKLKEENYLKCSGKKIILNRDKIDKYLMML